MGKNSPESNTGSDEVQMSQIDKSRTRTKVLTLIAPLIGSSGVIAIAGGILKFEPPNPALIIGGAIAYAAGISLSIPVRRAEERERKFNEENDLKAKESLDNAIVTEAIPEKIIFLESKI